MESSNPPQTHDIRVAQLTKGMEHMRAYVSVPSVHTPPPRTTSPPAPPHLPPIDNTSSAPSSPSVYGIPSTAINPAYQPSHRDPNTPKPPKRTDPFAFGSRTLEEGDDIFDHNAWDHVEVDDAFKEFAEAQYQRQRDAPVSEFDKARFNTTPSTFWNKFYTHNTSNFFKNRNWLFQEFPLLTAATSSTSPPVTILEVGAGAGNTAFPILAVNKNEGLKLHACDFSKKAVEVMRGAEGYDERYMRADVWDLAGSELPPGLTPGSVDILILIFIFSALEPAQWSQALRNIDTLLRPGGHILFRDYGRGDLAQVRFKSGRWLEENFYVRGDGTRVYFFEKEELEGLFGGGVVPSSGKDVAVKDEGIEGERCSGDGEKKTGDGESMESVPKFEIVKLAVDRRMLVNRQRRLKMYRCWMQGLFRKPETSVS